MKWDLTYHFKDKKEFEEALANVNQMVANLKDYEGKLHEEEKFIQYCLTMKKFEEENA